MAEPLAVRRILGFLPQDFGVYERLAEVQSQVPVSNLARRADGVHVRFVGSTEEIAGAVAAEPTLEDVYLATQLDAAAEGRAA